MLAAGAFLMQFFVYEVLCLGRESGASERKTVTCRCARGTFPGTVYQLGNFHCVL